MIPPIITVASGFRTSPPVPVAIAMGTKPREATSAVISSHPKAKFNPTPASSVKDR
jgi:hypothetical protein